MTPAFSIQAAGTDITGTLQSRLLGLSVQDEAGVKSDAVEITLDDAGNLLEIPSAGAQLVVAMGYRETGLVPMGVYTADEVTCSGPPDRMVIRGQAADMGGSLKDQKSRSWHDVTLGDIVSAIAADHGLTPRVSASYAATGFRHLDQTDESDINFLNRLARDLDALVSVKGGSLVWLGRGEGRTVSGVTILPRRLVASDVLRWRMTRQSRGDFASVTASWIDHAQGGQAKVTLGSGSPVKRLRHGFPSEAEARRAAQAQLDAMARGTEVLDLTIVGAPLVFAETQIALTGLRSGVSGTWSVTSVRHDLTSSGFTSQLKCERPKSAAS